MCNTKSMHFYIVPLEDNGQQFPPKYVQIHKLHYFEKSASILQVQL